MLTHHILLGHLARRPEEGGVNPLGQCPDCLRLELLPQKALQWRRMSALRNAAPAWPGWGPKTRTGQMSSALGHDHNRYVQ